MQRSAPTDLSKTTKLKDVVVQSESWSIEWITMTLQTITPKNRGLRHISIRLLLVYVDTILGETIDGQWLDLDRWLVQFWESRSIRPEVICTMGQDMKDCIGRLLPETTKRGIIDLLQREPYLRSLD